MEYNSKLPDLKHFTGTENWYPHPLNRHVTFTDGAFYVAEKGEAFWLLDTIALSQLKPAFRGQPFQAWKLTVKGHTGVLTCDDGNGNVVHREELEFTDFPEPGITLWLSGNVIMLPGEY